MKKLFMIAITLVMCVSTAMAQKGEKAVGANLYYGSEIQSVGIGAKFQYGLTDVLRLEPSFAYFLEKNDCIFYNVDANVHYLFDVADKVKAYPLAGLGYSMFKETASEYYDNELEEWVKEGAEFEDGKFTLNLGAGVEYQLKDNLSVGAELKYQIRGIFDQLTIGVGFTYKF